MLTVPLELQPSHDRPEGTPPDQPPPKASEDHKELDSGPQQQPCAPQHHDQHTHSTLSSHQQFTFIRPGTQRFTDVIPAFLRDFEENQDSYVVSGSVMHSQHDPREQSSDVIKVSPPPTLPLMLGKVILNSSSHLKDDNSVLAIPNHVVLNHLATSSIKNHVLAVSATTRYKKKVNCLVGIPQIFRADILS